VNLVDEFFEQLDRLWDPEDGRVALHVIGTTALVLQTNYERGTKDGDVLEVPSLDPATSERLRAVGGPGSPLHHGTGMYLDLVGLGVPLLPAEPLWHEYPMQLLHFDIYVLDVADVVISKLKRWSASDHVRQMVERGFAKHPRLVERLNEVIRRFWFDARADLLPDMVARFHRAETDWFAIEPSAFALPELR